MGRQLPDGVPEEIAASWRRARFLGLRHDGPGPAGDAARGSAAAPREAVRREGCHLLSAARPVLERLAPVVGAGRAALLLTDERLRVLWATGRATGAPCREDLSEQVAGNNSAALALRTRRRAEVHGPEHFLDLWQDVSAVSVPVLAPETGRAVGTVTVTTALCADRGPHPWASLAEAAAGAVEAELLARSRPAERVLLDAYLRASREPRRAVVALDGRNRLVSEAAGRLLSPEGLDALERSVVALLRDGAGEGRFPAADLPDSARPGGPVAAEAGRAAGTARSGAGWASAAVSAGGPGAEFAGGPEAASTAWSAAVAGAGAPAPVSVTAGTPGSYRVRLPDGVRCSAKVSPVTHRGSVIGAVAVLEPLGAATTVPPRRGAVALAGHSVPWRHAVGRATELARSPEPLLLVGERGTGKTALARELTPELLVVDAAEGELGSVLHALREGHALLIRHVERLAQPDLATLNSLLAAQPGTPLLATYTPGTPLGPCLQRFLDRLAARSVTLPALRERPETSGIS